MTRHNSYTITAVLIGVLIASLTITSCSEDDGEPPKGSVEGRVTDGLTGEPISDATISLTGEERRSETVGSDGTYSFENLLVGTYTIAAQHSQYESNSTEVSIQVSMTAEGDLELIPVSSLDVNPTVLNFSTAIDQLNISFTNRGTKSINYEIQTSDRWISLSKNRGQLGAQNSDLLTVYVNRRRLEVGNVQGSIIFNVPGKGNRKVDVFASKLSSNSAVLMLGNGSLDFGKSSVSETLRITNAGSNTLLWDLIVEKSWISTDQPDGAIPPGNSEIITVFVDRANQAEGAHSGILNFSSNGGNANVSIKMLVDSDVVDPGSTVVTSGLRAYYTFNDGTTKDLMDNFEAVNFGAITSDDIPDSNGKSFSFDGIDNFLQIAGNPIKNTNYRTIHGTLAFWTKPIGNGSIFAVPRNGNDQENEFIAGLFNGRIYHSFDFHSTRDWYWGAFGINVGSKIQDGNWHHVVLVYDQANSKATLFFDGIQYSHEKYIMDQYLNADLFRVGGDFYTGTNNRTLGNYSGLLDNIRIYNRPLSDSEVKEIFNARQ